MSISRGKVQSRGKGACERRWAVSTLEEQQGQPYIKKIDKQLDPTRI